MALPFLLLPIIKEDPSYFLIAVVYMGLVQFARLLHVGVKGTDALLAFTPFGMHHWLKMWQKDGTRSNLA